MESDELGKSGPENISNDNGRRSFERFKILHEPLRRLEEERQKESLSSVPFYAQRAAKYGDEYWRELTQSYMLASPIEEIEEASIQAAEELHRRGLMTADEVRTIRRIATEYRR